MELIIALFLILSIISYVVIDRNVQNLTKTPTWLLWLVLMIPAFVWLAWGIFEKEKSIPRALIIAPLIISPLLYVWLIEFGKPNKQTKKPINGDRNLDKSVNSHQPQKIIKDNHNSSANNQSDNNKKPKFNPISESEEKALKDCFPWGVYYLQKIDYLPQAILCLGKLMTAPEKAYPTVKANLEKVFQDRYFVVFQETIKGQPFFALVPNPYSKSAKNKIEKEKLTRPGIALMLLILTFLTTTIIGVEISGMNPVDLETNPELLLTGLPYSLCLIAILGVHELSHYLFAVYYRIKTTLPYFIPIPFFLGTFGAFISIKSPMPHRKAVFDVALAGPIGGFLVTVPVLVWGLAFSQIVPMPEQSSMLNFQALDPHFSFFFAMVSKLVFGEKLVAGSAISLHPSAVAGYIGLIVTALNLMPVGQLDGGHIVHAMFGQGKAVIIGQITRILIIFLAFARSEFILWAIILIFMPIADQPALNDVTELDNKRDFLGLLSLALLIIILFPLPPTIAHWLNI